ncbi:receptor-like protein EIX2 [Corylus avellana]|uniref:receptor-like protein EIX2 n=1 Tax=Corylus avellana TaxID=13451 RepID=UPI00286D542A|nr:receptor-like protein EIX2 [Corylus avellana]
MRGPYAALLLLLGLLLLLLCTATSICFGLNLRNSEVRYIEEERQALLKLKQSLQDDDGLLSSWGSQEEDCCNWKRIKCSNRTAHVVKLDLRGDRYSEPSKYLYGEINSSLLGLQHLTYLDLSLNAFSILPEFIGSLTKLQYLNLSNNYLSGTIPPQLGNLTSLTSLDLSRNYGLIEDHNLDWLFNLSSLRHLDMSTVYLSKVVNWPDKVTMLPSLLDLSLSGCALSMPIPPVLFNANSSSPLSIVDLSFNYLNSSIFPWLFKYTNSLVVLDLNYNELEGSIPKAFGNIINLVHLHLSSNYFEGKIPQSTLENLHYLQVLDLSQNSLSGEVPDLSKLTFLSELHLSKNQLNGSLPNVLGKLSKLQVLDLSLNSFEGVITEAHLSNLSTLRQLDFSSNSLSLKFSPSWVPPFHLDTINLGSCNLGPAFPQWLQTQKNFSWLDISNATISGTIPNWFWDLSFNINFLSLSHNQITGTIPLQWLSSRFMGSSTIDLSDNCFNGPLPRLNSNLMSLNFSNNLFQGSINTSLCGTNGSVTYWYLRYLDLSNNSLSGELPNCWANMPYLFRLDLAYNNFIGSIPNSIGSICNFTENEYMLQMLRLEYNNFIGELPKSLMSCSSLIILHVGENRLFGRIPAWIGTSLPYLKVLILSSNSFTGSIPLQLCGLKYLQILDLSHNNIVGTIPPCLNNFIAMDERYYNLESITYSIPYYNATFQEKIIMQFEKDIYFLFKVIDLSSNKLEGEIPREITSLLGLSGLNLSNNLLIGIIPQNFGDLNNLEFLDLSSNHLSGTIPHSLVDLIFLALLNLSYNNLSGRIPFGYQLDTFSYSSYVGNTYLCGSPLSKECPENAATQGPQTSSKHDTDFYEHLWLYTSIAIGFIVGFWGVCGSLVLKSSWRHAYFQFLDKMGDRLYVTIAINKAKLLRNFKSQCYQENT